MDNATHRKCPIAVEGRIGKTGKLIEANSLGRVGGGLPPNGDVAR
jgi:hypothetical protein